MKDNKCNNQYYNLALEYYNRDRTNCCVKYIQKIFPNGNCDNMIHAINCVLKNMAKNKLEPKREY